MLLVRITLIFDRGSFENINTWADMVKQLTPQHAKLFLVGNKIDRLSERFQLSFQYRQVTTEEAIHKAKSFGLNYV